MVCLDYGMEIEALAGIVFVEDVLLVVLVAERRGSLSFL